MYKKQIKPEKIKLLSEDNQIKAYVHPTRIKLLKMLAKEQRTISDIAKEFGVHPANITHHFKLLEKAGLILMVEKRDNGKNLEKYYRSFAYNFIVRPDNEKKTNKSALTLSILKNDLNIAINTVNDDKKSEVVAFLKTARITKEDFMTFSIRLQQLIDDYNKLDSSEGVSYNLNLSLYPNDITCKSDSNIIID